MNQAKRLELLERLVDLFDGNESAAARALHVPQPTLWGWRHRNRKMTEAMALYIEAHLKKALDKLAKTE